MFQLTLSYVKSIHIKYCKLELLRIEEAYNWKSLCKDIYKKFYLSLFLKKIIKKEEKKWKAKM